MAKNTPAPSIGVNGTTLILNSVIRVYNDSRTDINMLITLSDFGLPDICLAYKELLRGFLIATTILTSR